MTAYRFLTTFALRAPRDAVFDAVAHHELWAPRWPHVRTVTVTDEGRPNGLGRVVNMTFRAPLEYRMHLRLTTDVIEPPHRMGVVADGDLVGRGSWRLVEEEGVTHGSYLWQVDPTKTWMGVVSHLARPLLVWNHDRVMRSGIHALAAHLGVEPLHISIGERRERRRVAPV